VGEDLYSQFSKNGYFLAKNIFNKNKILTYEKDFDKIIGQIKVSSENINARWNSKLIKKYETSDTSVLHTHNVQSYSSKMLKMIQNEKLLDIAELLIGKDIILHHTKLFSKPPMHGAAFPLHQDWSYFPTEKNSMIAAVVFVSDCKKGMGRIRIVKGSHMMGNVNGSDGHSKITEIHGKHSLETATPISAHKGDVLFFHCCTLHGSKPNLSKHERKSILIQLYSGKDKPKESTHTNIQLTLRGWNYAATRNSVNSIKA
tara:strand:- start:1266 stop:2039 length:774 start_codon:yes stop_codon:yes gene_type:complete